MAPFYFPPTFTLPTVSPLLKRAPSTISHGLSTLTKRQSSTIIIPAQYSDLNDSLQPGSVIGIVFGSVAGFLVILWLMYTLLGGNMNVNYSSDVESVVIRERKRSHRGSSRRASRTETVEVRRPPVPVVERERVERVERVVVEEERRSTSRVPPPRVVSESSIGSDDEVVVIEEHSPPPRRTKSKRESGYRTVDPLAYGGGDMPLTGVERRDSRRSRG